MTCTSSNESDRRLRVDAPAVGLVLAPGRGQLVHDLADEVGAQADVVDAGDARDVLDVVEQHVEADVLLPVGQERGEEVDAHHAAGRGNATCCASPMHTLSAPAIPTSPSTIACVTNAMRPGSTFGTTGAM